MDISEQEQQLIEMIRENANGEFRVSIARDESGAWEIEMMSMEQTRDKRPKRLKGRGVGTTFNEAWDSVTGLQF